MFESANQELSLNFIISFHEAAQKKGAIIKSSTMDDNYWIILDEPCRDIDTALAHQKTYVDMYNTINKDKLYNSVNKNYNCPKPDLKYVGFAATKKIMVLRAFSKNGFVPRVLYNNSKNLCFGVFLKKLQDHFNHPKTLNVADIQVLDKL